ncbi:MAG: class I adenylate-forming enzyme family protein [Acidimicrobiales bacterium]
MTLSRTQPPLIQPVFPDHLPTVGALLRYGREQWPEADCVVTPQARLSYQNLDRYSRILAARLADRGVAKGIRVGVLFPNGTRWVTAWAAAARIGAVVIPINTFYSPTEMVRFLQDSDVGVMLATDHFLNHDYLADLESQLPELAGAPREGLSLDRLPQLRRVCLWGTSDLPWVEGGIGDGLDPGDGLEDDPDTGRVDALESSVTPSDIMLITYTSGSTGEPKGVIHGHGPLLRHGRNLAALSDISAASRLWTPMPLCWVGGFSFTLLRAMSVGAAFITQEVFEPGAALGLIGRERASVVSAWPAAAKALVDHPDFPGTDLSSLRSGIYESLVPERRPPDPGLAVSSLGMSETAGPHTFWFPGEQQSGSPEEYRGNFGHEVPGTEHRIIDPDTGLDMAPGQEGEVLVRGYSLMLGIHRRERAEVFDADGWYHTGDRGYFRDGWFFFTGRQSDLIKTAGSNVAPAEVEACLSQCLGVKHAFVVGVPHPDRGQDVVALVVPGAGAQLDADHLRGRLKSELSSYKVPRHFLFVTGEDVPYLTSQKADRSGLVALAQRLVSHARS